METSTTSTDIFDSSNSLSSTDKKNVSKTWIYILIILALFGITYYFLSNSAEAEHMSGGVSQQLQSIDSQDLYLSGGPAGSSDILGSGNYLYYWNMSTRNGGNRANWLPVSTNNNLKSQNSLLSVNVPGILSPADNTVFPRVNPKSTVSPYPDINNILVNQQKENDYTEKELSKEIKNDMTHGLPPRTNTLRQGSLNTLQNALVTACQNCVPGKCQGCPSCQNGLTSQPKADSVASNKVDAKSVGDLSEGTEYMTVENFDSGITYSTIPNKIHNKINKKVVKKCENFDSGVYGTSGIFGSCGISGISGNTMPMRVHKQIKKRLIKKQENVDSGLSSQGTMSQGIPSKIHDKLNNRLVKQNQIFANINDNEEVENFDSGLSTGSSGTISNSSNMSMKLYNKLNSRVNAKSVQRQQRPISGTGISLNMMPIKVHKKIVKKVNKPQENFDSGVYSTTSGYSGTNSTSRPSATSLPIKLYNKLVRISCKKQENFENNSDDNNVDIIDDVNDGNENLVKNPLRAGSNGCENCPQGRCVNCPRRVNECPDCPLGYPCKTCGVMNLLNNRDQIVDSDEKRENFACPCRRNLVPATNLNQKKVPEDLENFQCSLNPNSNECNSCSKCPSCRNGNCPTCPKNNKNVNVTENFESSVGFDTLCPCGQGRCTNCPQCRAGNCPECPKTKSDSTYIDLASFGTWHGGSRLGTNWNNASDAPPPVNINNSVVFYPDSYLGSYFLNPKPDIVYPYAVIPPSRTVAGLVVDSGK